MAYAKPGATVTQVQRSIFPNLNTPVTPAIIIGDKYYIHEIGESKSITPSYQDLYGAVYDNTELVLTVSGAVNLANVDDDSVYVDLIATTGTNVGIRVPLVPTTDFTVSTGVVTIDASILTAADVVGGNATVEVGYREFCTISGSPLLCEASADVEEYYGKLDDPANPLAMGVNAALRAGQVAVYGINNANGTNELTGHTAVSDILELRPEMYALAPLTQESTVHSMWQTYVNSMSTPANKGESRLFVNRLINWKKADYSAATGPTDVDMNKAATVTTIKADALTNAESRVYWIYPDTFYYTSSQRRHISTLASAYLDNENGDIGLNAKTAEIYRITLDTNGATLAAGDIYDMRINTELTAANITLLKANSFFFIKAAVPVPGIYKAAEIAGMVAGKDPQAPLTNVTIPSGGETAYSQGFFTESQLNTAASGGTYWTVQKTPTSPIVCRHQLSTDVSDIISQELSVGTAVDFAAIAFRSSIESYIGRYNSTPNILNMIRMTLNGMASKLVNDGVLASAVISSVAVDPVNPDTLIVLITLGTYFPINYIKITLYI